VVAPLPVARHPIPAPDPVDFEANQLGAARPEEINSARMARSQLAFQSRGIGRMQELVCLLFEKPVSRWT